MPEACGRRTYSTQRVGFLPQTEAMDTYVYSARPAYPFLTLHTALLIPKRRTAARVSRGKYGKDEKGGQTDQLATENTKLIRRRKNMGWEKE